MPASCTSRGLTPVTSLPATFTVPAVGLRRPVSTSISSLCPLASTPAMATISPARTSKRDVAHGGQLAVVEGGDALHLAAACSPTLCSGFSTRSSTSRPTIRRARLRSVEPSVTTVSIFSPRRSTVTRSEIVEHLVELVGDEHDRRALRLQLAQDPEEVLRLLRGQHRGRLVEHEHLGAPEQRAEDLHALLGADAEVLDLGVGVDREAEPLGELARATGRRLVVQQQPVARLGPQHQVLGHGHDRDEHEVLVDHPDAQVHGLPRRVDLDLLAVEPASRPRRAGGARRGRS